MDAQVGWNVAVEVTRWELMLRFVQHGMGLAILTVELLHQQVAYLY